MSGPERRIKLEVVKIKEVFINKQRFDQHLGTAILCKWEEECNIKVLMTDQFHSKLICNVMFVIYEDLLV